MFEMLLLMKLHMGMHMALVDIHTIMKRKIVVAVVTQIAVNN